MLLESLKRLRDSFPDAQLLKIGKAGDPAWRASTLRAAADLGFRMGDDIVVTEGISDELLAHAYRAADVFVTASLYEGFGLPALEAMAVGTPVVVTDQGALPEIVGDAGLIASPDSDALAAAIVSALSTGDRLVDRGRERAAELSWSAAADQYLQIFDEVRGGDTDHRATRLGKE